MSRAIRRMRKQLLVIACMALVVGLAIGGTIAWLTADTAPVTNTFAVGSLDIVLKENELITDGEDKGTLDEDVWTDKNTYQDVVPGDVVPKNPTVFVESQSESCYVFACVTNKVVVTKDDEKVNVADFVGGENKEYIGEGWIQIGETVKLENGVEKSLWAYAMSATNGTEITAEKIAAGTVTFEEGENVPVYYQVPTPVFEQVKIKGDDVNDKNLTDLAETGCELVINAYAHQASNLEDGDYAKVVVPAAVAWFNALEPASTMTLGTTTP